MKIFFTVLVLLYTLTLSTRANDIRDFQIEGLSIGNSLLDFMSEDEIINNKKNYFKGKRKYYVVGYNKNLKQYQGVDIYLKSGDSKYIIRTIGGMLIINLKECLKKKEIVKKEFDQIFSSLISQEHIRSHEYDKTDNSKQYQNVYYFGEGSDRDNHIRVECDNWSKKIKQELGWQDGLNVVAMTTEILDWIYNDYK